jgi:hypothetical protein
VSRAVLGPCQLLFPLSLKLAGLSPFCAQTSDSERPVGKSRFCIGTVEDKTLNSSDFLQGTGTPGDPQKWLTGIHDLFDFWENKKEDSDLCYVYFLTEHIYLWVVFNIRKAI